MPALRRPRAAEFGPAEGVDRVLANADGDGCQR